MESFSLLALRLATNYNSARAVVLVIADLYGRLNFNLVRANTAAFYSRYFVPDYFSFYLLFVIIVHVKLGDCVPLAVEAYGAWGTAQLLMFGLQALHQNQTVHVQGGYGSIESSEHGTS